MSDEANGAVVDGSGDASRAAEAAELASLMAGYNNTAVRAEQAPADVIGEPSAMPEEIDSAINHDDAPPPAPSLADELADLKARVAAMSSESDPTAVRRLNGEIGSINRTLQQMQAAKPAEPAPVSDELTAAMDAAEKAAAEFPELAGPLVAALKAINAKQVPSAQAPVIDVAGEVAKQRQIDAIEALAEEHPDFETVRDTPEFRAWEATKTPEYQAKLRATWNPAVVAKGLTEFKESLRVRAKKQDRLAAAVVTTGTQQQAKPSTLPDEAGLMVGYNSGPKRHIYSR